MRRSAEFGIVDIQFQTGSASAHQPEISKQLILPDTFKYKRRSRIEAVRHAPIVRRDIESLGHKSGTRDLLGSAPAMLPYRPVFAGETQMTFTRLCLPGLRG